MITTKQPVNINFIGGRVQVTINSLADAIEIQKVLSDTIQMAFANGDEGQWNTIPAEGDALGLRFKVKISQSEKDVIGWKG
jgi:hypothetical protein